MSTPAQPYAEARQPDEIESAVTGSGTDESPLSEFRALYEFPLDDFQMRACEALDQGHAVLVAAPTGSGKTVVGEFAAHLALARGQTCFYTTPIKALSNQKYHDLVARYGADRVGLLTGDNAVNGEAPIVVMTTEVLRNMLYAGSRTLNRLGFVVMDEVHYLADRSRGAVWEEVLIHLPETVQVASLSATVSNAEEFGEWLGEVRGGCVVVVEEKRPVPLWQQVMVGNRLMDLFVDDGAKRVNPELVRLTREDFRSAKAEHQRFHRGGQGPRRRSGVYAPSRVEVLDRLDSAGLLPAIVFVFSRAGCDAAVSQCLSAGLRLTSTPERREIRDIVLERTRDLPDEDLHVLGFHDFLAGLEAGIAAHHAGMLPTFKETVEHLFSRGLVRAVFATETLALGINMPARSVVLEKLVKWNGQTHADVTPAEYTQLTGRAGRRGIDVEGNAVVLYQQGLDPAAVAGLASTRTYPLRSSFRPSYNMAVNLVAHFGRDESRILLESSFAQFQADRAVVGMARQLHRSEEGLTGYAEAMACHLGDFSEYAKLRQSIKDRENELAKQGTSAKRMAVLESLEALRPGDVIRVPSGRFSGPAVVLDPGLVGPRQDVPRPTVLTAYRQVKRLSLLDFPEPVASLGQLRIPKSFNAKVPAARRDLAAKIPEIASDDRRTPPRSRAAAADDRVLLDLRAAMRAHPCHGCSEREDHARWAERYLKLERDTEQLRRRVQSRTHTISRQFDRVCAVLTELGYLAEDKITIQGQSLRGIYAELDLLAAESLRRGLWDDLDSAELAGVLAALTFESRRPDDAVTPKLPPGRIRERLAEMVSVWSQLDDLEQQNHLDFLREPDLSFVNGAYQWARGVPLEKVLNDSDLTAGDFVRAIKQLLDLTEQVADVTESKQLRSTARATVAALRRGVVSYSSVS